MTENKIKYQLSIVKPEKEKSGPLDYLLRHSTIEGNFPLMTILGFILEGFRNIFGIKRKIDAYNNILFGDEVLLINQNGVKREIKFKSLKNFKIHFNSLSYIIDSEYKKYSKIQFEHNGKEEIYFETINKKISKQICKKLYGLKIKFKEYYNEQRVFLGKSKRYKEIQELKERYKIEW